MKKHLRLVLMLPLLVAVVLGCSQPGGSGGGGGTPPATYTVTYNANGATGGSAPTDDSSYLPGATVTVLGNTGNLAKTGYTFADWNTLASGSGTPYAPGQTFTMGESNVTLYTVWTPTYVGTWVNPAYNGHNGGPAGKMVATATSFTDYNNDTDTTPLFSGTFTLADNWTSGGDYYFKGMSVGGVTPFFFSYA